MLLEYVCMYVIGVCMFFEYVCYLSTYVLSMYVI